MNLNITELANVLPNSYIISSAGCPCRPDHLHFKAEGYRKLGTRYAVKMSSLLGYEITEPALRQAPELIKKLSLSYEFMAEESKLIKGNHSFEEQNLF